MDVDDFFFRIKGFTPATLPMSRLADYMAELATLLGEKERVHFRKLKRGSAVLVARPEGTALPKVRERFTACLAGSDPGLTRSLENLNRLLANDNTSAELIEGGPGGRSLRLEGAASNVQPFGPVMQDGSVHGVLVRIGGRDRTAHAALQDGDRIFLCDMSRELARQMGPHLYGAPLRVNGRGGWVREATGDWALKSFTALSFDVLDDVPLSDIFKRLRAVGGFGEIEADDVTTWIASMRAD